MSPSSLTAIMNDSSANHEAMDSVGIKKFGRSGAQSGVAVKALIDVSFAAAQHESGGSTGVGRVIDEIVKRLIHADDIDVLVTGLYAHDLNPLLTDQRVKAWAERVLRSSSYAYSAFRSRFGLSDIVSQLATRINHRSSGETKQASLGHYFKNVASCICRKLIKADLVPAVTNQIADVFVITFSAPPVVLPESLVRVVIIYDIYPMRFPTECGPDVVGNLKSVIDSLSPRRDIVVAISEYTKQDFCDFAGFPQERVVVCPLAADDQFRSSGSFEAVAKVHECYRISPGPYFLSVSNPQPRKNLVTAIRAFAKFVLANPDWKGSLVLAGNSRLGWGDDAVDRLIADLGPIGERVLKIGPVDERDLPTLYSGAIGFVFPSLFEGFGLPVLEAMKCGVPVVASSATSIPEVGGDAAIYCDPHDVEGFANAMRVIVNDEPYRQKMIRKGYEQSSHFSWDVSARIMVNVIRQVVSLQV
jgi:glycosyltransferase involved in cell wall biosynthesis